MSSLSGKTILIVDDETEIRELLSESFRLREATVLEAGGVDEALEHIRAGRVDAIISDIRMPGKTGDSLLDEVKKDNPFKPVVVLMTGHSDFSLQEALSRGAEAYVQKPFKLRDMVELIERALAKAPNISGPRSTRYTISSALEVVYSVGSSQGKAIVANIGRGGMFLKGTELPAVGAKLSFQLILPSGKQITGQCVCRWARGDEEPPLPPGFGVQFSKISEDAEETFNSFLSELQPIAFIPKQ